MLKESHRTKQYILYPESLKEHVDTKSKQLDKESVMQGYWYRDIEWKRKSFRKNIAISLSLQYVNNMLHFLVFTSQQQSGEGDHMQYESGMWSCSDDYKQRHLHLTVSLTCRASLFYSFFLWVSPQFPVLCVGVYCAPSMSKIAPLSGCTDPSLW